MENLEKTSGNFDAVLAHLPGMAYRCAPDARRSMQALSEGCLGLTGHAPHALIGNAEAAYADLIHADDRAHVAVALAKSIERGEVFSATYRLQTAQGEKWVRERGAVLFDENGAATALEGFIQDVTECKRIEQQFFEAQKFEVLGRLVSGIAHDFNNHLTVVNGYSKLLLKDLSPDHPLRVEIAEIEQAGSLAAGLTRELLTFSRKHSFKPAMIDLNVAVARAAKLLTRLIGENIVIETKLADRLEMVRCDPAQIEQIVVNLAVNAREDMPHGGRVTLATGQVVIDDSNYREHPGTQRGPQVMLSVAGAPAETALPHVVPAADEMSRGAQLAFAAICGIVIEGGGSYRVRAIEPNGSAFEIFFPCAVAEPEPVVAAMPAKSSIGSGLTILLVEDEKVVRNLLRRILAMEGFAVLDAGEAVEAQAICMNYSGVIDLMLSDVMLPNMKGPQLARKLLELRPNMKIALMSGYAESYLTDECKGLEIAAYLEKPITPDTLMEKIEAIFA